MDFGIIDAVVYGIMSLSSLLLLFSPAQMHPVATYTLWGAGAHGWVEVENFHGKTIPVWAWKRTWKTSPPDWLKKHRGEKWFREQYWVSPDVREPFAEIRWAEDAEGKFLGKYVKVMLPESPKWVWADPSQGIRWALYHKEGEPMLLYLIFYKIGEKKPTQGLLGILEPRKIEK